MDISSTVCVCVCLCVCVVTDFSAEDKASGVKFCTAVHRRPRQEISDLGELCSPEAQNRTNRPARPRCNVMLLGFCDLHACLSSFTRRMDVGSACVDAMLFAVN